MTKDKTSLEANISTARDELQHAVELTQRAWKRLDDYSAENLYAKSRAKDIQEVVGSLSQACNSLYSYPEQMIMADCWHDLHLSWLALNSAEAQLEKLHSMTENQRSLRNQRDYITRVVENMLDNIKELYFKDNSTIPFIKDCSENWVDVWHE